MSEAVYDTLLSLRRAGKNDNMLKNVYVKFMCWLYYRFERVVNCLGGEKLPKILCEGEISTYELLLRVLSAAGSDIVLLECQGDVAYREADPESAWSKVLELPGMGEFPEGFSLKQIRDELREAADDQRLYGEKPRYANCTNAWLSGKVREDVRRDPGARRAVLFLQLFLPDHGRGGQADLRERAVPAPAGAEKREAQGRHL